MKKDKVSIVVECERDKTMKAYEAVKTVTDEFKLFTFEAIKTPNPVGFECK